MIFLISATLVELILIYACTCCAVVIMRDRFVHIDDLIASLTMLLVAIFYGIMLYGQWVAYFSEPTI